MQSVLFISKEKPEKYPPIDSHYTWVPLHGKITYELFSEYWHLHKPLALFTFGTDLPTHIFSKIFFIRKRWIHFDTIPDNLNVIPTIFSAMLGHPYDKDHPLFSIITTTFHSKHKILRPLRSLQAQSYTNWEWIIWDDSKDNETYEQLLMLQKKDLRLRVYKAPQHSGVIGEMKRLASGLAQGAFIVEVDHDDDLHSDLLRWIKEASDAHPEADFFYTDSCEPNEETYESATYGDFFGFGYYAHANVWSDLHQRYLATAVVAPPNAITLQHLVGLPNHVRCWRTAFYDKIGKHNPLLSVSDDYDLLVRSYLHGKYCHIRATGYYQYRNKDGNFTFLRNSLIQHNVKHIYEYYQHSLPARHPDIPIEPRWKYEGPEYPETHIKFIPPEFRYNRMVALFDPSKERILEELKNQRDSGKSFHLLIMGKVDTLDPQDAKHITWWELSSKEEKHKKCYIETFLHTSGNLIYA